MLQASSVRNPPPAHLYAADYEWWAHWVPKGVLTEFDGQLWTADGSTWEDHKRRPADWGITRQATVIHDGLDYRPGVLSAGGNSTYQAINLAWHFFNQRLGLPGRIILLGLDVSWAPRESDQPGKKHWFGDHPNAMLERSEPRQMAGWIRKFCTIRPADYDLEIWNCTRRTALTCFTQLDLDQVCAHLSSVRATRSAA